MVHWYRRQSDKAKFMWRYSLWNDESCLLLGDPRLLNLGRSHPGRVGGTAACFTDMFDCIKASAAITVLRRAIAAPQIGIQALDLYSQRNLMRSST